MNTPTGFVQVTHVTERTTEQPSLAAGFSPNGLNYSGLPGIGIASDNPNLEQQLPNWTLLDQAGNVRTPQKAGAIGQDQDSENIPYIVNGDEFTTEGFALLADLAVGWAATQIPDDNDEPDEPDEPDDPPCD